MLHSVAMRYNVTSAARRIGVNRRTVERWIAAGLLPAERVGVRQWIIEESDVERARERREAERAAAAWRVPR